MLDYASFPEQRQLLLRERLHKEGKLICSHLANEIGVSEHTIRRDIAELARQGLCKKVYGGAIEVSPAQGSFSSRSSNIEQEKRSIANKAVTLIDEHTTIFLDSGTTNLAIAQQLPRDLNVTLVTNSLPIAYEAMSMTHAEVIVIGGKLHKTIAGMVDTSASSEVANFYFDMCFLGVCAFNLQQGITSFNYDDAQFKRILIKQSGQLIAPVTAEKYATIAKYKVVEPEGISDVIISESMLSTEQRAELGQSDISLHLV